MERRILVHRRSMPASRLRSGSRGRVGGRGCGVACRCTVAGAWCAGVWCGVVRGVWRPGRAGMQGTGAAQEPRRQHSPAQPSPAQARPAPASPGQPSPGQPSPGQSRPSPPDRGAGGPKGRVHQRRRKGQQVAHVPEGGQHAKLGVSGLRGEGRGRRGRKGWGWGRGGGRGEGKKPGGPAASEHAGPLGRQVPRSACCSCLAAACLPPHRACHCNQVPPLPPPPSPGPPRPIPPTTLAHAALQTLTSKRCTYSTANMAHRVRSRA